VLVYTFSVLSLKQEWKVALHLKYTYFSCAYFEVIHMLLVLMFVYCWCDCVWNS